MFKQTYQKSIYFGVIFLLQSFILPAYCQHFAEENGWYFNNWKDDILSWEVYSKSYIGIPPTRDEENYKAECGFYDEYFKGLAKTGNCFGMVLTSMIIQKEGGYKGFCPPLPQFSGELDKITNETDDGPSNSELRTLINTMQGHQLGNLVVNYIIENQSFFHSGNGGTELANAITRGLNNGDPTLLCITEEILTTNMAGHTLLPYAVETNDDNVSKIYVYDPDRSWYSSNWKEWYQSGSNFVTVDIDGKWSFKRSSGITWERGYIFTIPLSKIGPTDAPPFSGIGDLSTRIVMILSGDGADIVQASDERGKRLFIPGSIRIDMNDTTGKLGLYPLISWGQDSITKERSKQIFISKNLFPDELDLRLKPGNNKWELYFIGKNKVIRIKAKGIIGTSLVSIKDLEYSSPIFIFAYPTSSASYDLEYVESNPGHQGSKTYHIKDLRSGGGGSVSIFYEGVNRSMSIQTKSFPASFNLEIKGPIGQKSSIIKQGNCIVQKDYSMQIYPKNWSDLRKSNLQIQYTPLKETENILRE
jgi:hypothetical protein